MSLDMTLEATDTGGLFREALRTSSERTVCQPAGDTTARDRGRHGSIQDGPTQQLSSLPRFGLFCRNAYTVAPRHRCGAWIAGAHDGSRDRNEAGRRITGECSAYRRLDVSSLSSYSG